MLLPLIEVALSCTHPNIRPLFDVDNVVLGDLLLVHAEGAPGGGGRSLLDERQAGRQGCQTCEIKIE